MAKALGLILADCLVDISLGEGAWVQPQRPTCWEHDERLFWSLIKQQLST